MIRIARFEDDFKKKYKDEPRKVVIYGAGKGYEKNRDKFNHIDMICDINASSIEIQGYTIHHPKDMETINEPIYISVTIMAKRVFFEVCDYLQSLSIDAVVFHLSDNISFTDNYWNSSKTYCVKGSNKPIRVNLVCEEKEWILHKFAIRMEEQLIRAGVDVQVTSDVSSDADLNHHIAFGVKKPEKNDTLMVLHVDSWKLFKVLEKQLEIARLGICMSKETMDKLVAWGIPRNKLCYINPAHDADINPRKIIIGITHRIYDWDLRKRKEALIEIVNGLNSSMFKFIIMGSGWEDIVEELRKQGFETEYYPDFDLDRYKRIVPTFDYYFFMGFDEGSMGYLDAVAAGVGTIVTPQGFHLDNAFPIDYPCRTVAEFHDAFMELQNNKLGRIQSVENWTWDKYTLKHLTIWEYLLARKPLVELYYEQLCYEDGIYSMLLEDNRF